MPFSPPPDVEARLREADAEGSADAAYALGVALSHRGERDAALEAWQRADERGSAEAAYAAGVLLSQADNGEAARSAWRRGAQRGSYAAAIALSALAYQAGSDDADRFRRQALELATVADEQGSADAACVVAQIRMAEGDASAAAAAWARADDRGSNQGALGHGLVLGEAGRLDEARAAAGRALARGMAAGGLVLGRMLAQQRKHMRARSVWRQTLKIAEAQGDENVSAAVKEELHPPAATWLRTHLPHVAGVLAGLLALGALGSWKLGAAMSSVVLALFLAMVSWKNRVEPGADLLVPSDSGFAGDLPTLSAGGMSVAAGAGDWQPSSELAPEEMMATSRDARYSRVLPALLVALAIMLFGWALRVYSDEIALRGVVGWVALLCWWWTAWWVPNAIRAPMAPLQADIGDSLRFAAFWSPFKFLQLGIRASISEPRLEPIIERLRRRADERAAAAGPFRRGLRALPLLTVAFIGVALAVLAVAPQPFDLAGDVSSAVAAPAGLAAFAWGVLLCVIRAARAIIERDDTAIISAVGYMLGAALLIGVAYPLGLLHAWVEVFTNITSAL